MQALVLRQEECMRAGNWDEAVRMMPDIAASYRKICAVLHE